MSGGGVLGGVQVEVSNDAVVEYSWIQGALTHAQQHYQGLLQRRKQPHGSTAAPPPVSGVSEEVDEVLYRAFRTVFPALNVTVLQPDDPLWPYLDREYWKPLLRRYASTVADATLLTLIRVDVCRPPVGDNAILVPRLKWVMLELAREREGVNGTLREEEEEEEEGVGQLEWGGDDDDEEKEKEKGNLDEKEKDERERRGQGGVTVGWSRTARFWTLHLTGAGGEKAVEEEMIEDMVAKLGGGDDVRALVTEEVRRQAASIDLVAMSNQAAVTLQAAQSSPPKDYESEASRNVMLRAEEEGRGKQRVWPVVLDGVLTKEMLSEARHEAKHMRKQGLLARTPQAASGTRLDSIRWLTEDDVAKSTEYPALHSAVLLLKGLAHEIMCTTAEQGSEDQWGGWRDRGLELRVPKQCMLACYPGGGAYYVAHRDNLPEACMGQGGGNDREVTAVLYLNEQEWNCDRLGGALRCYSGAEPEDDEGKSAREVRDVAPVGGRLVLFPSRELLHEVVPSSEERWALSIWILGAHPAALQGTQPGAATILGAVE